MTVDPLNAAIIIFGFAGLGIGMAACPADRPRDPEPDQSPGRTRTRLLRVLRDLAIVLILLDVIVAGIADCLTAQRGLPGRNVPGSWTRWVGWTDAAFARLAPVSASGAFSVLMFDPGLFFLIFGQVWITWRVIRLLIAPVGDEPAPLDVCLGDRRTFGRFAIRWLALTVLMVAAIPTFFIAGLGLFGAFLRASG